MKYTGVYLFILHLTPSRLTDEVWPRAFRWVLGVLTHFVQAVRHVNSCPTDQFYLHSAYLQTVIRGLKSRGFFSSLTYV